MADKKPPPPPPSPTEGGGGEEGGEVPDGAAVFPLIPAELLVDPLLLAALHGAVFLAGSDESIVQPDAADEALERLGEYLRRLEGDRLRAVKEDMACLVSYARQQKWQRGLIQSLRSFLADMGVSEGGGMKDEG